MERVQFQQEQMLDELKDLEEKGLFSKAEIKTILKKRTAFESALVRRIPKKSDFLRYAEYEMGLETLRRQRVDRLQTKLPPSLSDFALVRRQFHIFERALRKFREDVALWVQYIESARREGARALVGRISARALQLHPNTPSLYAYAAQHEAAPAARALLQRGLRLNSENIELWVAYVRFEFGFVERMRRRWRVLGVDEEANGPAGWEDEEVRVGEDEVVAEEARREIMRGAIVRAVIDEAAKAIPQLALFRALRDALRTYPTSLRDTLLDHLHELLLQTLPADSAAHVMHATRLLPNAPDKDTDIVSVDFINRLRDANEALLVHTRGNPASGSGLYADFVEEWSARDIDANIRIYLVSCLQTVAELPTASAHALAVHLRLMHRGAQGDVPPAKIAWRAAGYTARADGSVEVWLARLDAEARMSDVAELRRVWREARRRVAGEGMERVWMWGLEGNVDVGEVRVIAEELLRESLGMGAREVHEVILMHYVTRILHPVEGAPGVNVRLGNMRRVLGGYLATGRFYRAAFEHEESLGGGARSVLEVLYEGWRRYAGEEEEAVLAWARWLLGHEEGGLAAEVVVGTGAEMRWREELDEGTRLVT